MIIRIVNAIFFRVNKISYLVKSFWCKEIIKQQHYIDISCSQLIINFIFQRIFGINKSVPFSVSYTTKIQGFKNIKLPANSDSIKVSMAVSGGCYISVFDDAPLTIGENTLWAFNVCIQTGNHDLYDRNKTIKAPVTIGKNCWLGNSVTILAGVEIGDNVTVGANSVVTKSFPSNVVIGGCPAKVIKILS
jgi:acetyltransferase-like isoleucine patch superfamily enzyme